jgi:hypothetical protein
MCKEFIYNPSPILFIVDYTYKKFVNKILCICDVLIGHGHFCIEDEMLIQRNSLYLFQWDNGVVISLKRLNNEQHVNSMPPNTNHIHGILLFAWCDMTLVGLFCYWLMIQLMILVFHIFQIQLNFFRISCLFMSIAFMMFFSLAILFSF